jgi:hypothetical protein
MGTQIYLKVYSATGVVRKSDAKKMTKLHYWALSDGVLEITAGNIELAKKKLAEIRAKKYTKHYNFIIEKKFFTTECEKQIVKTKVIDNGSIN